MSLIVQDFDYTPVSELGSLTFGRRWNLCMQVNLQQVPEGTVNALYITASNNFGQGPGDQVIAVQPMARENGYSFMFAIGSVSGNGQHIDESVWPLGENVSIVLDAQDEFTTVAIECSTTQSSFTYPLAPFEARPQGLMHVQATGPWFSTPVGLLKSLTFQTEDFQPPPDVQPQEQEKPEEQVQQAEEQVQEATEITQQWIAKRPFFLVTVEDFAAVLSWFEARPEGLDLASVTF